jgi:hypothetical protein
VAAFLFAGDIELLESASMMKQEPISFERRTDNTIVHFSIPSQGVVCLSLEI